MDTLYIFPFLSLFLSYLIGAIPFGLIVGKVFWNIDLRKYGSKNIGATNAWRTIGKSAGFLIFLLDMLKGVLGVYICILLSPEYTTNIFPILGGIFVILGHTYSIFLKFSGGKGVATGLGVILILMPKVTIIIFLVWFLITYFTRYVSLASITAAFLVPILSYLLNYSVTYTYFGILIAILVIYKHRSNIDRLIKGIENKV